MVIRGTPKDIENYFMADGDLAFTLHQKGFMPLYVDCETTYFKMNKKLKKYLKEIGVEIED